MSKHPLPMVEAELQYDPDRMDQIVAATAADDPMREYYVAIAASWRAPDGSPADMRSVLRTLGPLLANPPKDVELFQVLLMRMVRLTSWLGNVGEALRAMRLLERIGDRAKDRPEMRAVILLRSANVQELLGKFDAAFKQRNEAVEILGQRRDRLWFHCKCARIVSAIMTIQLDIADRDLKDIEPLSRADQSLLGLKKELQTLYLDICGRHEEALAAPMPDGTGARPGRQAPGRDHASSVRDGAWHRGPDPRRPGGGAAAFPAVDIPARSAAARHTEHHLHDGQRGTGCAPAPGRTLVAHECGSQ